MAKIEVLNPFNDCQLEKLNDFCLRTDLPNLVKTIKTETKGINEEEYFRSIQLAYVNNTYLLSVVSNKVTDYCHIHSEKDTRKAIITYPPLLHNYHHQKFIDDSIDYDLNVLNMEELFLNLPSSDKINKNLIAAGYLKIDDENSTTTYFIAREEKNEKSLR